MIRASIRIQRKNPGGVARHVRRVLDGLRGPRAVKVGFPKGKTTASVIAIAVWNHEGTSRGIPRRPFLTIAMFKSRARIRQTVRTIANNVWKSGRPLRDGLAQLGEFGKGIIRRQIASNTPPPNAPGTIARKGSSRTLIVTGGLRQSTTWDYDR